MKYGVLHLLLAVLVLLTASQGVLSRNVADGVTAQVEAGRRAVIAFLPPSMQNLENRGAAEAQARVTSAVENTKLCLGDNDVSYWVVFADRIVVRSLGREETFDVGDFAPLVGAVLLRADASPRILFAGGGPEALPRMLQSAAGEYFGRGCK